MDLESLFDAPPVPPQKIDRVIGPLITPTVPLPPFTPDAPAPVWINQRIDDRDKNHKIMVKEIGEQRALEILSKKDLAFQKVQDNLVDASNPAVEKIVSLLEAKRTIQTKDGGIIEVPDPKTQLAAAKDLLDRAGHQAVQKTMTMTLQSDFSEEQAIRILQSLNGNSGRDKPISVDISQE